MVKEQSRGAVLRSFKRPLVLFLIAAGLLAVLAISERQAATPVNGDGIARRSRLSGVFGTPAGPARAVPLPASGSPAALAPAAAAAATPEQAMATAQNTANAAVNRANQATGAAVAAQAFPPFVSGIACPILLRARLQVVVTIDALIAAYPFLAAQLNAIRASALASIDAQIQAFACVPSM